MTGIFFDFRKAEHIQINYKNKSNVNEAKKEEFGRQNLTLEKSC